MARGKATDGARQGAHKILESNNRPDQALRLPLHCSLSNIIKGSIRGRNCLSGVCTAVFVLVVFRGSYCIFQQGSMWFVAPRDGNAGRDDLEDACSRGSGIARNCPELPGIANANGAELLLCLFPLAC